MKLNYYELPSELAFNFHMCHYSLVQTARGLSVMPAAALCAVSHRRPGPADRIAGSGAAGWSRFKFETFAVSGVDYQKLVGRGLHSSTFQLNLSRLCR